MADMPKEPSVEELLAELKKAKEKIRLQKRKIDEMKDAQLKNKTMPSKGKASKKQTKTSKKKKDGNVGKKNAKSKNEKAKESSEEESSEESDGGWDSEQSSEEDETEEEQSDELDENALYNTVVEWCENLKVKTTVPAYKEDQKEINDFIDYHYDGCLARAEKKLKFKIVGLSWAQTYIKTAMMDGLAGDMQTVDENKPENCQICKAEEVTLADDGSNFRACVFECEGLFMTEDGRVSKCPSAICLGCSNMPETWTPADAFWCPACNNPATIASSTTISEKQKPVYVYSKPEKPPEKVKEDLQVVNVFGGGGKVSLKSTRKMLGLKDSKMPTIAQVNRCGFVVERGYLHESRKLDTPRAAPRAVVNVKYMTEFEPNDKELKQWNKKEMFSDILEKKIDDSFKRINTYKQLAGAAISEIKKHLDPKIHFKKMRLIRSGVKTIRKHMDNLPLAIQGEKKAKAKKRITAKVNKYIEAKLVEEKARQLPKIEAQVKIHKTRETHNMEKIKAKMHDILQLMRIVRDTTDKAKFDSWEEQSSTVWDEFECDDYIDELESIDSESEDDDNERDDMVNNEADNLED